MNAELADRMLKLIRRAEEWGQRIADDGGRLDEITPILEVVLVCEGVLSVWKGFGEVWDEQRERLDELFQTWSVA